jgi:hypothetical protein
MALNNKNSKKGKNGIISSNMKSTNKMIKYNITRIIDLAMNLNFISQIKRYHKHNFKVLIKNI